MSRNRSRIRNRERKIRKRLLTDLRDRIGFMVDSLRLESRREPMGFSGVVVRATWGTTTQTVLELNYASLDHSYSETMTAVDWSSVVQRCGELRQ